MSLEQMGMDMPRRQPEKTTENTAEKISKGELFPTRPQHNGLDYTHMLLQADGKKIPLGGEQIAKIEKIEPKDLIGAELIQIAEGDDVPEITLPLPPPPPEEYKVI